MDAEGNPSAQEIDHPGSGRVMRRDSRLLWKEWWMSLSGQEADDARRWGLEPEGELWPDQVGLFWSLQVEIRRNHICSGNLKGLLGHPAPGLMGGARLLQRVVPRATRILAEELCL